MLRLTLLFTALLSFAGLVRADDAVFIVNPAGADASISAADATAILLGNKTKWDGGGLIKLAVLTQGEAHEKIMHDFLQRSADQFDKYWKKMVFSGKGMMPMQAASDADLIAYVAKTPGSVGYVAAASVTGAVKVLPVK
ncbi:MAG: hypothetical protein WC661_19270 [Opitutaceae bacterium]|jgi:ABC-type phosphate transport system substrate-binding protein